MNYKEKLDEIYKAETSMECPPEDKFEFLGNHIFNFTTYDSGVDSILAKKMLDVCQCIVNKKTFAYIDSGEDNYLNYITMVNMPFLKDKLDWGGSIRGAWFDKYGHNSEEEPRTYMINVCHNFSIPKKEICNFISQLIEWSKVESALPA